MGLSRRLAPLAALLVLAGCGGGDAERATATPSPLDPGTAPLRAQATPVGARGPVDVQAVAYTGAGGEPVAGLLAVPRTGATGDCVVFQSGIGSDKEQAAGVWPTLAGIGAATFTIDARKQGAEVPRAELDAALGDPDQLYGLFRDTAVDLRRGLDWLEGSGACDGRIAYVGVSFGGITGALVAGADDRIAATVLMVAGGDWPVLLRGSPVLAPSFEGRDDVRAAAERRLAPIDPVRWVGRIAPRPLLLVAGRRDDVIPPAATAALRAAAPDAETLTYAGGHDPFTGAAGAAALGQVRDWLQRQLSAG